MKKYKYARFLLQEEKGGKKMKKYKYVRVPIRKKRRSSPRQAEGYGLFSASDIGFGYGGSSRSRQPEIGAFDFGGAYGGKPAKQLSVKQTYMAERKALNRKLEDQRYSRKLETIRKANSDFEAGRRREFVSNVQSGAQRVGSTISGFFKRK